MGQSDLLKTNGFAYLTRVTCFIICQIWNETVFHRYGPDSRTSIYIYLYILYLFFGIIFFFIFTLAMHIWQRNVKLAICMSEKHKVSNVLDERRVSNLSEERHVSIVALKQCLIGKSRKQRACQRNVTLAICARKVTLALRQTKAWLATCLRSSGWNCVWGTSVSKVSEEHNVSNVPKKHHVSKVSKERRVSSASNERQGDVCQKGRSPVVGFGPS